MTTEKIEQEAIEPCPFCEEECRCSPPTGMSTNMRVVVQCTQCTYMSRYWLHTQKAEAIRAHNTLAASARAVEAIAEKLTVMFCSAEASEGLDGFVSGYYIRTGAIHSIVGMLDGLGHTVLMPSDMPKPKAEEAVAVAEEALDAVYFAHFVDEHHPETDEQRIAKTALAKIDALTNTKDTDHADTN